MDLLRTKLDSLIEFMRPWMPLANSHMVSFITKNLWSKYLPEDIQKEFESLKPVDCFHLFFGADRHKNEKIYNFITSTEKQSQDTYFLTVAEMKTKIESMGFKNFKSLECGMQFMSVKKNHEVEIMSELVAALCEATNSELVIDVGDGKGYLSSIMTLEYNINVLGIDSSPGNTSSATKRVEKMKKHWNGVKKKIKIVEKEPALIKEKIASYRQHTKFIEKETDILKIINSEFPQSKSFGIVGLHTCGKLSPVCLDHFVNSEFKFLVNVGCCYHLMDEGVDCGFPMSEYLKNKSFTLGRNARMLSLQAPDRIRASNTISSQSLMFRAVFEKLLFEKTLYDGQPQVEVGRISAKCKNFVEYCRKAVSKLPYELEMSDNEIDDFLKKNSPHEPKLQFYFMTRVFLAPILEKIILYDRLLFLKEKGFHDSFLVEMFDPVVSPRCYGIVGIRST